MNLEPGFSRVGITALLVGVLVCAGEAVLGMHLTNISDAAGMFGGIAIAFFGISFALKTRRS